VIDRSLRDRYSRQTIFTRIGDVGQARLLESRAVIIGCGALGCNIAGLLARAGLGNIRIIDRDFIEYHNLQRQVLFDEADIKAGLPKAIAAEQHLRKINSTIRVQGIIADVNFSNIEKLCRDADIILDGLDNYETRFLINDFALKYKIPWVYGGAVMSNGMTMNIIPGKTPCFRCIHSVSQTPDALTCETAGVVGSTPAVIGSLQAMEAIKILLGAPEINRDLIIIDVWADTFDRIKIKKRQGCPACNGQYEFLDKKFTLKTSSLCGQSRSVQIINTTVGTVSLHKLADKLTGVTNVSRNRYVLCFDVEGYRFFVYPDGRTVIKGTPDTEQAEKLYRKYVGRLLTTIR
jgi:molybdopterin/thiamine biosynthesis adenylyltransferase